MADAAIETKPVDEQVNQTTEAPVQSNDEKDAESEVKTEAPTTNGEAAEDVKTEDAKDNVDGEKDEVSPEEDGSSQSPDKKRKTPPPVSTHERQERKRSRGGHQNKSKIKTRFDEQEESSDPDEIRRQVEFYFSDSNLPIDAYLLDMTGGHRNLPVPLKTIHNFKRMHHFQPFSAVRDAVKASKFLNLDDRDEITRKEPLDEKYTENPILNRPLVHTSSMPRSIYAKGFGEEQKDTHLNIEAFFAPYGPINSVRLRRHDDGEFKGSVFVEFKNEVGQERFLELDPKPQYDGKDLEIMSKQDYVDKKHKDIHDGVVRPKSPRRSFYKKDGKGDRRGSRDFDKDDWKQRRDHDNRNDRGGRGGRGRGRFNDRGGRGGRGRGGDRGRGNRNGFNDRKRNRDDDDDNERGQEPKSEASSNAIEAPAPTRAEAEARRLKSDEAAAGAEKSSNKQTNGSAKGNATDDAPAEKVDSASKKRGREDEGEGESEAKKIKAVEES